MPQQISINKQEYGGWKNCVKLSNGLIDLIATTDVGPRVIRFGFIGQHNELLENPNDLGKTGGDEYRAYGGHRMWHAPEAHPRTYMPDNQPVLKLYGPPGTGKTRSMLELFEEELQYVNPNRIAFLTFTRSAKAEVLARASMPESELPWVKTIHAICYKLLRVQQNQMISILDLKDFGKRIGTEIRGVLHDPWSLDTQGPTSQQPTIADRLLQLNHLGRHKGWKLKEMLRHAPSDLDFHFAKWFTETYREWKKAERRLYYTDLLTRYLTDGRDLDIDVCTPCLSM